MSNWSDLAPRVISGVAMAAVAALAVWLGICDPEKKRAAIWLGIIGGVILLGNNFLDEFLDLTGSTQVDSIFVLVPFAVSIVLPSFVGLFLLSKKRKLHASYALAIQLTAVVLYVFRWYDSAVLLLFIIGVVVITDVAGYFAGRLIGGPKFWPKVSPKKTWSGTIAGWIGAAIFGGIFSSFDASEHSSVIMGMLIAVSLSFAGQMGDIVESAMKRSAGIKDSSNLIPGHGGFLDRFDAIIGACIMVALISLVLTAYVFLWFDL
jgi:phosphatidate cytidylyltransferase